MMTSSLKVRRTGNLAALAHRLTGLALTLFLPLHFLALGLALEGAETLDGFLAWTDSPLLKITESGLLVCLALHLTLGLRVLALELLPWRGQRKNLVGLGLVLSLACGLLFLFNVFVGTG